MSGSSSELFACVIQKKLRGLELKIKSPAIEEVMRLISNGRISTHARDGGPWGPVDRYVVDVGANGIPPAFPGFSSGRFDLWGNKELILARAPTLNLSMLLAVGLKDGVTLAIPTVLSEAQLNTFVDALKSAVRQFFIDFLKESERSFRITTEEI